MCFLQAMAFHQWSRFLNIIWHTQKIWPWRFLIQVRQEKKNSILAVTWLLPVRCTLSHAARSSVRFIWYLCILAMVWWRPWTKHFSCKLRCLYFNFLAFYVPPLLSLLALAYFYTVTSFALYPLSSSIVLKHSTFQLATNSHTHRIGTVIWWKLVFRLLVWICANRKQLYYITTFTQWRQSCVGLKN